MGTELVFNEQDGQPDRRGGQNWTALGVQKKTWGAYIPGGGENRGVRKGRENGSRVVDTSMASGVSAYRIKMDQRRRI